MKNGLQGPGVIHYFVSLTKFHLCIFIHVMHDIYPKYFATNHIITHTNNFCALICSNYVCTACGNT